MKTILVILAIFFFSISNLEAGGNGGKGGKSGKKTTPTTEFVDGFHDELTPGVLCPWEQLNPCEGRRDVFVLSETKRANGSNYYLDYPSADDPDTGHIDVCMLEKDAPTGLFIYGLFGEEPNLTNDNGCVTPCHLLLLPVYTNRFSCHENVQLDQSQGVLNFYPIEVVREHARPVDNFFCHTDYLPPNISKADCLASTSRYCFRGPQDGETGDEYEAYLEECLITDWTQ